MSSQVTGSEGEAAEQPPSDSALKDATKTSKEKGQETLEDDEAPLAGSLYGKPANRRESRRDDRATRKNLYKRPKATHDQVTRRWLAILILGVVGVIHLGVFASFLFGQIDGDGLTKAIAALAGPQSLAAAAVGFYYADHRGHK